jgi:hypothetical protein
MTRIPMTPNGSIDEFGVDAVEESAEHVTYRGAQHGEYCDCDEDADDRVSQRKAQGDPTGAEKHGQ